MHLTKHIDTNSLKHKTSLVKIWIESNEERTLIKTKNQYMKLIADPLLLSC